MGYVVDAGFEQTGVAKYALLDPAADINSLEQVFIITNYTTDAKTETTPLTQNPTGETTAETTGETTEITAPPESQETIPDSETAPLG